MKNWIKKEISKEQAFYLRDNFGLELLEASVFARRGIVSGQDLLFYLEDNPRFLRSPFCFSQMEDAVDRILLAAEEGEKVLIFGDRDVDGITATAILFEQLKRMNIDARWRLPRGEEAYGISMQAVEEFSKDYGSLLITVDCGISNKAEIQRAQELGISVIVTDHHTPPDALPPADIIINPKCEDSGYPFSDISGCAVAFKLCEALRFAKTNVYKEDVCLLNATSDGVVECVKVKNLCRSKAFKKDFSSGHLSLSQSGLAEFLRGQQIFVWDAPKVLGALKNLFGNGVEFNLFDLRPEAAKIIPSMSRLSLKEVAERSKFAKYFEGQSGEIDAFFNIFVTYIEAKLDSSFPKNKEAMERDLQLVALSVFSDIMPLKDENRIFARHALDAINLGRVRPGLVELMSMQGLLGKRVSARDLGWSVIPALNAAGRIGSPEDSLKLFLEENSDERDLLAQKIISHNERRKELELAAWESLGGRPERSLEKFGGKFCLIVEEKINRGVIGRIAARLAQRVKVPSIAIAKVDGVYVGSMRTARGVHCVEFLDKFGSIYINHGGHSGAAGFSLSEQNFELFLQKIGGIVEGLRLGTDDESILQIDAELASEYVNDNLLRLVDRFEPYGNDNKELVFMTRRALVAGGLVMGKGERQHLKLLVQIGDLKWPALWWDKGALWGTEIKTGDSVDIAFNFQRNFFNGHEERQLAIADLRPAVD